MTTSGTGAGQQVSAGMETLATVVRVLKRWRLLVLLPLATAALTAAVSLVIPAKYVASASFVPEESSNAALPSSLAGLAAQFGLPASLGSARSPDFYADLLRGRSITDEILLSRYVAGARASDSTSLLDYLGIKGSNDADRLDKGRRKMAKTLTARVDRRTNIVRVLIELKDPVITAAVANRYVKALNDFNISVRETVGRARRQFVEERLAAAQARLRESEDDLRVFYERNARYQDSPQLVFQQARLQRAVTMAQDLYTSISREYEAARIAEVNDTPVITVLDTAVVPVRRAWPRRKILVLAAAALAAVVAGGLGLVEVKQNDLAQSHPGATAQLRAEWAALRADVASSVRKLFRRAGPPSELPRDV